MKVSKVVGLVVWDKLQDHCSKYGLIHPNHHGSVGSHACVTAVGQLQDAATRAAEVKKMTVVVMLG